MRSFDAMFIRRRPCYEVDKEKKVRHYPSLLCNELYCKYLRLVEEFCCEFGRYSKLRRLRINFTNIYQLRSNT